MPKPYGLIYYFDGMAHKLGNDKWTADDEEIRYAVYTTLVQGARGVMFWLLSKSEQEAFEQAEKIAEEVVRDLRRWRWEDEMPLLRQHKISPVKSNRRRSRSR